MAENFTTTDIYLAGVLFAKGVRYLGLESRPEDWRDNFCFDQPDPALLSEWQGGILTIGALAFANALRKLKRDVKQHQKEKENHHG